MFINVNLSKKRLKILEKKKLFKLTNTGGLFESTKLTLLVSLFNTLDNTKSKLLETRFELIIWSLISTITNANNININKLLSYKEKYNNNI